MKSEKGTKKIGEIGHIDHLCPCHFHTYVTEVDENGKKIGSIVRVECWATIRKKMEEGPDFVSVVPMIIDPTNKRGLVPVHLIFKKYEITKATKHPIL